MKNKNKDQVRAWKHEEHDLLFLSAVYRRQVFPKHFHHGYVIGINTCGAHKSTYQGGTWTIPPGKITVICPGEIHTGISAGTKPWTYRAIYPSVTLLKKMAGVDDSNDDYPVFHAPVIADLELYNLFIALHIGFENRSEDVLIESLLSEFMFKLVDRHSSVKKLHPFSCETKIIKTAIEYMHDSFSEPISIDTLSSLVGLSKFYFICLFKSHTGMTPHAFINNLKVRKAKELLNRKQSLTRIANDLGFADQAHFTKIFRQISGVTPGTYMNA